MHHIEMYIDGNGVHRNVVEHVVHNVFFFKFVEMKLKRPKRAGVLKSLNWLRRYNFVKRNFFEKTIPHNCQCVQYSASRDCKFNVSAKQWINVLVTFLVLWNNSMLSIRSDWCALFIVLRKIYTRNKYIDRPWYPIGFRSVLNL